MAGARRNNRNRGALQRMPRFYFDVREGMQLITDDEGFELADIDAAEQKAITAVADISAHILPRRVASRVSVEVRDGDGVAVVAVTVTLNVDR